MRTLKQFIADNNIKAIVYKADSNPNVDPKEWGAGARHFKVRLTMGRDSMRVPFSQGSAHTEDPTAEDVLECLASDAAGIENAKGDFEEWCSEYGYDTDSRKAERTFHVCEEQAEKLKTFLGDDLYDEILWHIDQE